MKNNKSQEKKNVIKPTMNPFELAGDITIAIVVLVIIVTLIALFIFHYNIWSPFIIIKPK